MSNSNSTTIYDNQSKFFCSLASMTETERKFEIFKQINLLNYQFFKQTTLDVAREQVQSSYKHPIHVDLVHNYWKLKRRFNKQSITASNSKVMPVENKPLMFPKIEDCLTNQSERFLISRIKSFVKLRQDLEKVRNLCYMVIKREKLKLQFIEINQQLCKKQADYLVRYSVNSPNQASPTSSLTSSMRSGRLRDILQVKNADCIYDNPEFWSSATGSENNLSNGEGSDILNQSNASNLEVINRNGKSELEDTVTKSQERIETTNLDCTNKNG